MKINRTILPNGLRVVHQQTTTTDMLTVGVLYKVGSSNESPKQTGFAHLFEHLMFGGTKRFPDFDEVLQKVGGDNNAYTCQDYTFYYDTLPAAELSTALTLELDRMNGLAFTPHSLEVQRSVVMEEFKETHLNQPYGDMQHLLARLAYATTSPDGEVRYEHPYSWPVIGLELSHIANAKMSDVKDFFHRFYRPDNAILTVVGNVTWDTLMASLTDLLPHQGEEGINNTSHGPTPVFPRREAIGETAGEGRRLVCSRPVPQSMLVMSFYIPPRTDPDYPVCDMLTDVLSNGKSSRLYHRLVEQQRLFLAIDTYADGRTGEGQIFIEAVPAEGVDFETAEAAVWTELQALCDTEIDEAELQKQKNKFETNFAIQNADYQHRAEWLAIYEMMGDARELDNEVTQYQATTAARLRSVAKRVFARQNSCVLYYKASPTASHSEAEE